MKEKMKEKFNDIFHHQADSIIFSPGRINIIGEHIDYNGGDVLPASIDIGTYFAIRRRNDTKVLLYSENFSEAGVLSYDLTDITLQKDLWSIYPLAVMQTFADFNFPLRHGFECYVLGNIPNGSGLSSSASLEVGIGYLINQIENYHIDRLKIVQMAQFAERHYVGVNVGIMDMFSIMMGKKDSVTLLNTHTLAYQYAKANFENFELVIINTNKERKLSDSKYNERRSECDRALQLLQPTYDVANLCELSVAMLPDIQKLLQDDVLYKRVRHVVSEQARTHQTYEALKRGDITLVGTLLNDSHLSLRDDYEVSGDELDTATEIARNLPYVLGSRMTGAGFGGCAIALVESTKLDAFEETVREQYTKKITYAPTFYRVHIADGTREI